MTIKNTLNIKVILSVLASAVLLFGCESETPSSPPENIKTEVEKAKDDNVIQDGIAKFKGEIFSVPSPIQVVISLKKEGAKFDPEVLNNPDNVTKYNSQFQQALNMGVYGADLAYVSAFQKNQDILRYFSVVKGTAEDLGIKSNIDQDILVRFGDNIGNIDSLYALSGELYKEANNYLNDNNRNQVATLILTGGWVESMNVIISSRNDQESVKQKLGEQKSALRSLNNLLAVYDDPKINVLRTKFGELQDLYLKLESKYSYIEPITDKEKKTTYLKSKTQVIMSDDELTSITSLIKELREEIIK